MKENYTEANTNCLSDFLTEKERKDIIEVIELNLPYMRDWEPYDSIIEKLRENPTSLTDRDLMDIQMMLIPVISKNFNKPEYLTWQNIHSKLVNEMLRREHLKYKNSGR